MRHKSNNKTYIIHTASIFYAGILQVLREVTVVCMCGITAVLHRNEYGGREVFERS